MRKPLSHISPNDTAMTNLLGIGGRSPAALREAIASTRYEEKRGRPNFKLDGLMAIARGICGHRERPDMTGMLHGLEVLLGAVESEAGLDALGRKLDRKSTRLNSSHVETSYAVFCLKQRTT